MESITTTKHPFSSFILSPFNPHTKPSFTANFSHFKKLRKSLVCFSHRPSSNSNPRNPRWPKPLSFRKFPLNPIWVLVPVLQSIRVLASSRTQKWASFVQAYTDSGRLVHEKSNDFLQNSGIGLALLSVTTNAKVKISPFVAQLAANPTFVSGMFAWFMAQSIKVVLNFFVERKWDLRILYASGGMPSSHSALCTALTTSVALCHGVADSLFPVCLGFSLIVMYDAIGVRRHAGMQAEASCNFCNSVFFTVSCSFCSSSAECSRRVLIPRASNQPKEAQGTPWSHPLPGSCWSCPRHCGRMCLLPG